MLARFGMPAAPLVFCVAALAACTGTPPTSTFAPTPPQASSTFPATPSPAPPTSATAGTFTMGDAGCRYDGPATVPAGSVTLAFVNESGDQFDADLWLLDAGHGYDELAAHAAEEDRRLEEGLPSLGHPALATLIAETTILQRQGTMTATLVEGTYGMACIRFVDGAPADIWAAGPLTIAD